MVPLPALYTAQPHQHQTLVTVYSKPQCSWSLVQVRSSLESPLLSSLPCPYAYAYVAPAVSSHPPPSLQHGTNDHDVSRISFPSQKNAHGHNVVPYPYPYLCLSPQPQPPPFSILYSPPLDSTPQRRPNQSYNSPPQKDLSSPSLSSSSTSFPNIVSATH